MRPAGRRVRVEPVPELELAAEQAVVVAPGLQVARRAPSCWAAAAPAPRGRGTRRAPTRARSWPRPPSRPGRARTRRRRGRWGRRSAPRRPGSGRGPGRPASSPRRRGRRTVCTRSARRPARRRSSRAARRAAGSRSGTATKLSRCDQRTFSWNRVSVGSEQLNVPRDRGVAADGEHLGARRARRRWSTSAYRNPWNVNDGSRTRSRRRRPARRCRWPWPSPQRAGVQAAVRLQHLGVPHGDGVAGLAADGEPDDAGDVLAGVEQRRRRPGRAERSAGERLDDPDGRRHLRLQDGRVEGHDGRRRPAGVVEARLVPAVLAAPQVDRAAVVQVGASGPRRSTRARSRRCRR